MNELDAQAAQAVIDADRQRRVKLAAERVNAVLAELACELVAQPMITADGRISAQIAVVARA